MKTLSRRNATAFRKRLVYELEIAPSYARHLCNGTRQIPVKHAALFEKLSGGAVSRLPASSQFDEQQ